MNDIVSIITPMFNSIKYIENTIISVQAQTYQYWELIIVDNSSSDNTALMLNQYNTNKIKVISVNNEGVKGYSRNIGIQNFVINI